MLDVLEGVMLRDFRGFATTLGRGPLLAPGLRLVRLMCLVAGWVLRVLILGVAQGAQVLSELEFLLGSVSQYRVGVSLGLHGVVAGVVATRLQLGRGAGHDGDWGSRGGDLL